MIRDLYWSLSYMLPHYWLMMLFYMTYFVPYITVEIIFLISYAVYLLKKEKRLSGRQILFACAWSFILCFVIPAHSFFNPQWHHAGLLISLVAVPFGMLYFLLIWGVVCIVRKHMERRNVSVMRKRIVYTAVLLLLFYLYYPMVNLLGTSALSALVGVMRFIGLPGW